ncbi:toxin-antitoxin system YwqK family antitoxin [Streptomyces sp. NPDC058000]|uniref:toxin-antitoxin system YwqK family antitoxin n=1 Tax=Streptomyces sp. NPDC058000 TaxID=3346299 RepID=UPI0036E2100C
MIRIDLRIDHDDIATDADLRLEYRGVPFTGEVVEAIGDHLLSQMFYVEGIPHGPDREWWADGRPMSEGQSDYGVPAGVWRKWHHNGQLAREQHFDSMGDPADIRTWDEDGHPTATGSKFGAGSP